MPSHIEGEGFAIFLDRRYGGRGAIFTVAASAFVQGQTLGGTAFERRNEDFTPDTGTIDQPASFGEDAAGNLYIVDLDGEIYRLISA